MAVGLELSTRIANTVPRYAVALANSPPMALRMLRIRLLPTLTILRPPFSLNMGPTETLATQLLKRRNKKKGETVCLYLPLHGSVVLLHEETQDD